MTTPSALPSSLGREFASGERLRVAVAEALNEAEGKPGKSQRLSVFLTAVNALIGTKDTTVPTVSTRTHDAVRNKVIVTFNDAMARFQTPPISAFAILPARTITSVCVEGTQVILEYSGVRLTAANTPTVAYTQPSLPAARLTDAAGNLAATFAAAAIVVTP